MADFSAQAIINTYLNKAFPNDPIIGEEDSKDLRGDAGKVLREKVYSLTNGVLNDDEKLSEEQASVQGGRWGAMDKILCISVFHSMM